MTDRPDLPSFRRGMVVLPNGGITITRPVRVGTRTCTHQAYAFDLIANALETFLARHPSRRDTRHPRALALIPRLIRREDAPEEDQDAILLLREVLGEWISRRMASHGVPF